MSVENPIRPALDGSIGPERVAARSIPLFVWLTSLALGAVALLGSVILPQLIIPDEKHHADLVLMAQEGDWIEDGWPGIGDRLVDQDIIDASLSLGPREAALRENRAAQHPPLFYVTSALASNLVTSTGFSPSLAYDIWTYRLVSVLAAALLPVSFYLIAKEVTSNRWVALTAAVLPLGIPGITLRNGAMVNPDSLLMLLTSFSVLLAVRVAKGDLSKGTGLLLGLSTGLASLTKAHGLLLIPVIIFAYTIDVARERRLSRRWLVSVGLASGSFLISGGWWWIRNLVLHGAVQPVRHLEPVTEQMAFDWATFDWSAWGSEAVRRVIGSSWGGQYALGGRYNTLFWILTGLLIIGCLYGWFRSENRLVAMVSGMYAVVLIPAVFLTSAFLTAERGRVVGIQGRYLFPALAGLAPLAMIAAVAVSGRFKRWLPTVFVAGSITMSLLAVGYMLKRYWTGFGPGWDDRWSAAVTTAPLSTPTEVGILLVAGLAVLALWLAAVGLAVRDRPG